MAKQFSSLDEKLKDFIKAQKIFFVATAPRQGRVNNSPKGMDSLRVLDDQHLIWLNLTGSGNESAAHVAENGRMTLMWCSFDKAPLILRVYGRATTLHPGDQNWDMMAKQLPSLSGARQIFHMKIEMVQTSCGFAVPLMNHVEDRPTLLRWAENKGDEGIKAYWQEKNMKTIDGLETGMREVLAKDS